MCLNSRLELMDPQRWSRIESLYHAAVAKTPDERGDYLAIECARIRPAPRGGIAAQRRGEPLRRMGPYEIVGLLGLP